MLSVGLGDGQGASKPGLILASDELEHQPPWKFVRGIGADGAVTGHGNMISIYVAGEFPLVVLLIPTSPSSVFRLSVFQARDRMYTPVCLQRSQLSFWPCTKSSARPNSRIRRDDPICPMCAVKNIPASNRQISRVFCATTIVKPSSLYGDRARHYF